MARLALILPNLHGGGAERVAVNLARDFVQRGHEIDIVLGEATGKLLGDLPEGVRIVDLAARRLRSVLFPLVRYFRSERPDGALAFMWPLTVIAIAAKLLSRLRFPLVVSEHSPLSRHFFGRSRHLAIKATLKSFYPLADHRVAVSESTANDLCHLGSLSKESIEVIRNPVTFAKAQAMNWPSNAKLILTVGNLVPAKDHPTLLRAFARLPFTAFLMIVGGGDRQEIKNVATALGIGHKVFLHGHTDPAPFYAAADLFVLSSVYEGSSLVIVEALLNGLPIVSTDCGGPRELLGHGEFGRLVPPRNPQALADAMAEMLNQKVDRARQISRGNQMAGRDSFDEYLRLLLSEVRVNN